MKLRTRNALTFAVPLTLMGVTSLSAQTPAVGGANPLAARTPTPHTLARIDLPIHPAVAPSPDGRYFVALQPRPDPMLWVVPADGGAPFPFRRRWAAHQPRWSQSGDRIGFIAAVGPPRIWTVEIDPESGRPIDPPRFLIRISAGAYAFSPDGKQIALVPQRSSLAGASEIQIVDWESRKARRLLTEAGIIYRLDWSPDGRYLYYGLSSDAPDGGATNWVRRVPAVGGPPGTLRPTGEFLGLSPDGAWLLHRPPRPPQEGERQRAELDAQGDVVELARPDGGPAARLRLPEASWAVRWAADSRALIQVRSSGATSEILRIPLPQ